MSNISEVACFYEGHVCRVPPRNRGDKMCFGVKVLLEVIEMLFLINYFQVSNGLFLSNLLGSSITKLNTIHIILRIKHDQTQLCGIFFSARKRCHTHENAYL